MDQHFEFTREQLVEAFKTWNQSFLENPDKYSEIDDSKDVTEAQANHLLEILEKVSA